MIIAWIFIRVIALYVVIASVTEEGDTIINLSGIEISQFFQLTISTEENVRITPGEKKRNKTEKIFVCYTCHLRENRAKKRKTGIKFM